MPSVLHWFRVNMHEASLTFPRSWDDDEYEGPELVATRMGLLLPKIGMHPQPPPSAHVRPLVPFSHPPTLPPSQPPSLSPQQHPHTVLHAHPHSHLNPHPHP